MSRQCCREGIRGLKGNRLGINPQEAALPGLRTSKATKQWLMGICGLAGAPSKTCLNNLIMAGECGGRSGISRGCTENSPAAFVT